MGDWKSKQSSMSVNGVAALMKRANAIFEMSVGEKRNKLIHMAKGEYFSFIDDDDLVSESDVTK